jgi:hydrogenase/urease accessory protein HupE
MAALLAAAGSARAHGAVQGMNSFYAGLLHPFQNLPHLLLLVGLGIWLGQRRPLKIGAPMLALALGSALALLATTQLAGPVQMTAPSPVWPIAAALCVGVLVASALGGPSWLRTATAALAGIAVALDSGVDGAPAVGTLALMLLGTWVSVVVLVANVAYYVSLCPPSQWVRIGLRILGSWLAAASVLVLAFYLKT